MSYLINLYVILGFSSLLSNYLSNVCYNTAAERQIKRIRNNLYQSIIRQDMSFFDKNTPGELTAALIA
jgi:ABC-type multidrug transport system fused ATPase/permease subunit